MLKNLTIYRSEKQLFLIYLLVQITSGYDSCYHLDKLTKLLELESGCLEDETIDILLSTPSSVTFLPNSKLSVSEDELSYILRTKEGPAAKLKIDTGKMSIDLKIGDIGTKGLLHGRTLGMWSYKTEEGKIGVQFEVGNYKEGKPHGFVSLISEVEGLKGTIETTAEMGVLSKT